MPFTEQDLRATLHEHSQITVSPETLAATARRRGRTIRLRRRAAAAGLAAAAIATVPAVWSITSGTGPAGPGTAGTAGTSVRTAAPDLARVDVSVLRGRPTATDYVPYPSPAKLAAVAEVVTVGTVEGYSLGPRIADRPGAPLRAVIMSVRVEQVIKGTARHTAGGRVHIEFWTGRIQPLERYRTAIAPGTRLIAFLSSETTSGDNSLDPPGTGHPPGTVLLAPYQQGIVFEERTASGPRLVGGLEDLKNQGPAWNEARSIQELAGGIPRG